MTISQLRRSVADAGWRRPTFVRLHRHLADTRRQGEVPRPDSIVLSLLLWAEKGRYRSFIRWEPPVPAR